MDNQHHSDSTVVGPSLVPKLEIIRGDQTGKLFTLKFKTGLGREADNDIALTDPKVSRYHCQISYEEGQWLLTDLGSANGTFLNGMAVGVPQPVAHGDQIAVGETILAFRDPLNEQETPFDPSSTVVGGAIPLRPAPPPRSSLPGLAWVAGGLVLILLLAVAGIILWLRRDVPPPVAAVASPEVITPIRTTPLPEANLSLKFEDDFSASDSGWDDAFGKYYTKQYGNNQYHIEITTNNLVVWGLANRQAADFEVEVETTLQAGEAGNTHGIIFRYVDHDNYYRFDVSDDGFFLLSKFQAGQWETLINWTPSTAINPPPTVNVLKVSAFGPQIAIFANGKELTRVTDGAFSSGNFGFFASTFDNAHIWVSFDNLKLWAPENQEIAVIPTPTPAAPP
ncbi:MAG: FHA domain-containing protein, partial [Anaerolineae bacterium]